MRPDARLSAGLAVLLVLAIGLALTASLKPVAADEHPVTGEPVETVTTELQPGWNLAGWTEPAAAVETIFETIPELEAVYSWDADYGRFRLATRTDSGDFGNLSRLTPGMGLWLSITGEEPVFWTRPIAAGAASVSLREGWNLVVWAGEDGIATRTALQNIDDILTAFQDANGREPQSLRKGDAFWLKVSTPREWWQPAIEAPAYELPRIEFSGEFSSQEEEAIRAEVEGVVAYFARRFDIWVSDLTITFVEVTEIGNGLSTCGTYQAKRIRLLGEGCFEVLAHEYAHAIQDKLGTTEPRWLAEGVANRWEDQYLAHTGTVTYADQLANTVIPLSQTIQEPLLTFWNQGSFGFYTPESYFLAQLGTEYLVGLAGEQSLYDFFALVESHSSWHDAFSQSFGLSIYEFSERFEEYREQVAPMFRSVSGRVMGSDSKPIAGVFFDVYAIAPGGMSYIWYVQSASNFDGTFSVVTPGGRVALEVFCPNAGGGWYTDDGGLSLDTQDLTPLVVGEASPDIVVRLPVSQAEAGSVPCSSSTLVLYTILGTNGEPVGGLDVSFTQSSRGNVTFQDRTTTNRGEVAFPVGNPSDVWISIDPETKCPVPKAYEGSVLLGRVDIGGGFSPSQYWIPPNTTFVGVEAELAGERTIKIDFAEDCP